MSVCLTASFASPSVYPECFGLHVGGGGAPAGVLARGPGEVGPGGAAEGPRDVLQRHPAVLQEDPPQDAGHRRAGDTGSTQLWTTGNHGNQTLNLVQNGPFLMTNYFYHILFLAFFMTLTFFFFFSFMTLFCDILFLCPFLHNDFLYDTSKLTLV